MFGGPPRQKSDNTGEDDNRIAGTNFKVQLNLVFSTGIVTDSPFHIQARDLRS